MKKITIEKDYVSDDCMTDGCRNKSQHASGLCQSCRKVQCKRTGCTKTIVRTVKSSGYCDSHTWVTRLVGEKNAF